MTSCDLCGKIATGQARIEGVTLTVCANCMTLGTVINPPRAPVRSSSGQGYRAPTPITEFVLVVDFGKRLRTARQRMKLSEKDAGLKLNIKESTLLHFEAGKVQPDEVATRKLEKFFGITLTE